jgi:hypothetical protein
MNRYEKEIKAIDEAMLDHVNSYKEIYASRRRRTASSHEDERDDRGALKAIEVLKIEKKRRRGEPEDPQDVEDIGRKLGPAVSRRRCRSPRRAAGPRVPALSQHKSLGEQFTDSAAVQERDQHLP